jgi:hypothetical protein
MMAKFKKNNLVSKQSNKISFDKHKLWSVVAFVFVLALAAVIILIAPKFSSTGQAGTSCFSDKNCLLGDSCIGGQCQPKVSTSCLSSDDCSFGQTCLSGVCKSSTVVSPPITLNGCGLQTSGWEKGKTYILNDNILLNDVSKVNPWYGNADFEGDPPFYSCLTILSSGNSNGMGTNNYDVFGSSDLPITIDCNGFGIQRVQQQAVDLDGVLANTILNSASAITSSYPVIVKNCQFVDVNTGVKLIEGEVHYNGVQHSSIESNLFIRNDVGVQLENHGNAKILGNEFVGEGVSVAFGEDTPVINKYVSQNSLCSSTSITCPVISSPGSPASFDNNYANNVLIGNCNWLPSESIKQCDTYVDKSDLCIDNDNDGFGKEGTYLAHCKNPTPDCDDDWDQVWRNVDVHYKDNDGDGYTYAYEDTKCIGAELPFPYVDTSLGVDCHDGDSDLTDICPSEIMCSNWAFASNLLGNWRGERAVGSSTLSNHGISFINGVQSDFSYSSGIVGNAFSFSGEGGTFIDVDDDAGLSEATKDGFTINAWVYPEQAPSGVGRVVASTYFYKAGTESRGWNLGDIFGDVDRFSFSVIGNDGVTHKAQLDGFFANNLNKWTQVVGVFESGKAVKLYVNGKLAAQTDTNLQQVAFYSPVDLRIGARADSNRPAGQWASQQGMWKGLIDEVGIYDRALSVASVRALYWQVKADSCTATGCTDNNQCGTEETCSAGYCRSIPPCPDSDGDGYGSGSDLSSCTEQIQDCNDGNKAINPGAEEICMNKIDDNCDGNVDENCAVASLPPPTVPFTFSGGERSLLSPAYSPDRKTYHILVAPSNTDSPNLYHLGSVEGYTIESKLNDGSYSPVPKNGAKGGGLTDGDVYKFKVTHDDSQTEYVYTVTAKIVGCIFPKHCGNGQTCSFSYQCELIDGRCATDNDCTVAGETCNLDTNNCGVSTLLQEGESCNSDSGCASNNCASNAVGTKKLCCPTNQCVSGQGCDPEGTVIFENICTAGEWVANTPSLLGDLDGDGKVCSGEVAQAIDDFYADLFDSSQVATAIDNFYGSTGC